MIPQKPRATNPVEGDNAITTNTQLLQQAQQTNPNQPKYAVVQLAEGTDYRKFIRHLLYIGQPKVTFLKEVHDHPNVKSLLSYIIDDKGTVDLPLVQTTPMIPPPVVQQIPIQVGFMIQKPSTSQIQPSSAPFTVNVVEKKEDNITLSDFLKGQMKKNRWSNVKEDMAMRQAELKPVDAMSTFEQTMEQVVATRPPENRIAATWNDPKTIQVNEPKDPSIISEIFRKQNIMVAAANAKRINDNLPDEESSKYMMCKLCNSKIMISRYSNLANHVKRHSSVKQYQCAYCGYQNNEQAKVRLHMSSQHQDTKSNPMDHFTTKLQKTWSMLMQQCFPDYITLMGVKDVVRRKSDKSRKNGEIDLDDTDSGNSNPPYGDMEKDEITCIECFQSFLYTVGEEYSESSELCAHLKSDHNDDCIAYKCDECAHVAAEEWKVRLHISMSHSEKANEVTVSRTDEPIFTLFIEKYFPKICQEKSTREDEFSAMKILENLVNGLGAEQKPNEANQRKTVPKCRMQSVARMLTPEVEVILVDERNDRSPEPSSKVVEEVEKDPEIVVISEKIAIPKDVASKNDVALKEDVSNQEDVELQKDVVPKEDVEPQKDVAPKENEVIVECKDKKYVIVKDEEPAITPEPTLNIEEEPINNNSKKIAEVIEEVIANGDVQKTREEEATRPKRLTRKTRSTDRPLPPPTSMVTRKRRKLA